MRSALRAVVFVAVCGVTWAITAQLRAKPQLLRADPPQRLGATKQLGRGPALPANAYTPTTSGYAQVRSFSVEPVDGKALASFDVSLRNTIPDTSFLWVARVFGPDNTLLHTIHYDDQIFSPELGVEIHPTFRDLLDVPRGKSRVMVTLYHFPTSQLKSLHGSFADADQFPGLQHFDWIEMP